MPRATSFPVAATIAGVHVVTIPAADYAELLDCQRRLAEAEWREAMQPPLSAIERDPEVAAFLADRFARIAVYRALSECHARFGGSRTPSKSAAYRYRDRLRRHASLANPPKST